MSDRPATQRDIKRLETTLASKADMTSVRTELQSIGSRLARLITSADFLIGKSLDNDRTITVFDDMHKTHRLKLEDHEKRIGRLEGPR